MAQIALILSVFEASLLAGIQLWKLAYPSSIFTCWIANFFGGLVAVGFRGLAALAFGF
ncbi:hypothetical protein [Vibrio parahaemolyticus]|uniref:hypothetical protein n=1 Tax=Vibrio parahaemolyticus TaxID=670 RepID=UPI001331C000|nr:hypothetical protein [Vibrio parahaemolyticus]